MQDKYLAVSNITKIYSISQTISFIAKYFLETYNSENNVKFYYLISE